LSVQPRSYLDLWQNGERLAGWLQDQGVENGDAVILMLRNRPEIVETMVVAALIGATFVPLDIRSIGEKLAYMVNHVAAKAIIAERGALAALDAVAGELENRPPVLVVDSEYLPVNFRGGHDECDIANARNARPVLPDPA
jgi:carnitine-CoA ligase